MGTRRAHSGSRTLVAVIAAVAGSAITPTAIAQNAMGDGRALDAPLFTSGGASSQSDRGQLLDGSLRVDTRYNAARPDFGAEIAFRNAIATGNAPGGLSFRGDLGYTAPFEFRGQLGSDDLFAFRRDSLYSGLAGMGIRGTEAVQYQFALTTGGRVPQNLIGGLVVPRDPVQAIGVTPGASTAQRVGSEAAIDRPQTAIDPEQIQGGLYSQLRAPSAYTANRGYLPFLVNTFDGQEPGQRFGIEASSLRGIKIDAFATPMGQAAARVAVANPDGSGRAEAERPQGAEALSNALLSERPTTAFDELMDRVRQRAEEDAQAAQQAEDGVEVDRRPEWERRLDELRDELLFGTQEPEAPAEDEPQTTPGGVQLPDGTVVPGAGADEEEEEDERPGAGGVVFDAETMRLIRDGGAVVTDLVDPAALSQDPYVVHLRAGQELLAGGRYFGAEERFTRALSIQPQDPTAQVGRVHAQLGAGLVLSSGINLRSLLIGTPALVSAKYGGNLLPQPERVEELKVMLRENLGLLDRPGAGTTALDPQVVHDSGLLLAYLGWQTGDERAIAEGLDAFETSAGDETGGSRVDERLGRMLRAQWLPGEE